MTAALRSHHRTARAWPRFVKVTWTTFWGSTNPRRPSGSQASHATCLISHLLLLCSLVFVVLAAAQARLMVEWRVGRLSVSAERVPLSQVLREVARRTGIEVQGFDGLQDPVSVRFSNLPLPEGLEKLLAQMNYAILERSSSQGGARPALVVVSGRRPPPAAHPSSEGTGPEGEAPSEGMLSSSQGMAPEDEADDEAEVSEFEETAPEGEPASGQSPEERAAALRALVREGNDEALREAILDPDPFIQATLFQVLDAKERQRVLSLLNKAAKSEQSATRLQSLQLLEQSRQEDEAATLAGFREALADEAMKVKEQAIQAVTTQGGADALDPLRQTFRAADRPLKVMILENVAQQEGGLSLLQEATGDDDEVVRAFAAFWLKQAAPEGR